MKFVVAIKQVPDTETKIKIAADGKSIEEAGVKWVVSPFDEFALQEAINLRNAGEGEVVAVCAGREASQKTLRQALAVGADRALLINDERYERCDALQRATALAAVVRAEEADLVFLGKYGVGTDEWQTGPMLAELLGWPHVGAITKLELDGGKFTARRDVEGGVEVLEGNLPAVMTCEKGLNEPAYASLKGIMAAKKKPLDIKTPADLGIDVSGLDSPKLIWEGLEVPPARTGAKLIDGEAQEAAVELARLLREEAKVI
jgi:electron transfer flavoprotein beta subunit